MVSTITFGWFAEFGEIFMHDDASKPRCDKGS